MKHPRYPHVFEPITYGPLRLKNRIIGLPMMSGLSTPDGRVTKELVAHMGARAKTGWDWCMWATRTSITSTD